MDPYLVVSDFENSLIARDPLFRHAAVPPPIQVKGTENTLNGLGITLCDAGYSTTLVNSSRKAVPSGVTIESAHSSTGGNSHRIQQSGMFRKSLARRCPIL